MSDDAILLVAKFLIALSYLEFLRILCCVIRYRKCLEMGTKSLIEALACTAQYITAGISN